MVMKKTTGMSRITQLRQMYPWGLIAGSELRIRRSDEQYSKGDFSGIRINIWNSAKVRRFLVHTLRGGGSHNLGYHAMRWETITHGEFGKYAVLSTLPDTIARFLYENHDSSYTSLELPQPDIDRSSIDVHGILKPYQVWSLIHVLNMKYMQNILWRIDYIFIVQKTYFAYFVYFLIHGAQNRAIPDTVFQEI